MEQDGRFARGEARRLLLLDAAVRVIAREGTGSLTHRAAAAQADVSLASATYHFPNIEEFRRAVFDHAGSRIGLAFRAVLEAGDVQLADIPRVVAEFSASLTTVRREDTVAIFEMIVATVHRPELRSVIEVLDNRLADLLAPYVGNRREALTVTAAIQGLILTALASNTPANALRVSIEDLVCRFRHTPDNAARHAPGKKRKDKNP
ncbi:TetR/AcrR family transcriptional regulator [Variovorax sp. ZT5P49]|uniref:TetR/AcrR family transcriptional regulator n=1 Tax=Variovorax sp. ZT5P49 TaxID=3443733 RepID=UPI003F461653